MIQKVSAQLGTEQTCAANSSTTISKAADLFNKAALLPPWSWGCVSAMDPNGRTIWIADAHRDDGKRFVVYADEKLKAFLELESAIRACGK